MHIERKHLSVWLLSGMLSLTAPLSIAKENKVMAGQVVSALENTFEVHPGERRNHIKGTCATGEFVGSSEAQVYTRSALFSGKPMPVVARFSMPGGNPKVPDSARHGFGVQASRW